MAEKYDKNGYNEADFKRNSNQDLHPENEPEQDGEDGTKLNEKAGEYVRELLSEKIKLNNAKFPLSLKLIDQEVTKVQASGRVVKDAKYVDVYREKPAKVVVKVLVPVKEHPKFNFVGKLLGPKGNTLKQLQEETMCKMAILGRGSMRDRQKEEELRNSLDPKYMHLSDELHVEISALAPPAEAHARIAYALAEVKKYFIPEASDMIRQTQMRDIMERDQHPRPALLNTPRAITYDACSVTNRSLSYENPVLPAPRPGGPPPVRAPPRMPPPPMPRAPGKSKVISILDRARSAMESSPYGYDEPPYGGAPEPPVGHARGARGPPEPDYYYERERYYEEDYYKDAREKGNAREVGTRRPPAPVPPRRYRAEPYPRPAKYTT